MFRKQRGLAIVNRNFWPKSQVLGEALLRLAERAAETDRVCIVTQSDQSLKEAFSTSGRGDKVEAYDCKARTTSSSGIVSRVVESLFFMVWTFISLIRFRPEKIYVATDPPVIVPFIVFLYSKLFGCKYYYHLQDIHPEAANIIVPVNGVVYRFLRCIDNLTIRHSHAVITLSEDMRQYIHIRSGAGEKVHLLENPSFEVIEAKGNSRKGDVVFCGNAGRLQRIPLLIESIKDYIQSGGKLTFTFIGRGIYTNALKDLASSFDAVSYLGYLPAQKAAEEVIKHKWALLPIEDEVTKYAFPSKSSSYVQSGCGLIAVCGEDTSVAGWVLDNGLGVIFEPCKRSLVEGFLWLENQDASVYKGGDELLSRLEIDYFVSRLLAFIQN